MDAPSIPDSHLKELESRYPYAFYTWNRISLRFELWCDENRGGPPYKFMTLESPEGEFRHPGSWVIDALRKSDSETGEWKLATKADRKAWIQSLEDRAYLQSLQQDRDEEYMADLRSRVRHLTGNGRVTSMDQTLKLKERTGSFVSPRRNRKHFLGNESAGQCRMR